MPLVERGVRAQPFLLAMRRELVGAERCVAVEQRLHAHLEHPALAVRELEREADDAPVDHARLRKVHDRARGECRVGEDGCRAVLAPRRRRGRGKRDRGRVAEAGVELLDGEDVGEVCLQLERDLGGDAGAAVVLDPDALVHQAADEALALDRELVRLEAVDDRVARDELDEVRRGLAARQKQRRRTSDGQHGA
ncbi:MAG TPA: hypothetical protein VFA05_00015 [Gaiellaceae bacterium]|nr:hypothetical protein [Gaiellaceae bacterium]